jgi:hypothetical protein
MELDSVGTQIELVRYLVIAAALRDQHENLTLAGAHA